MEWQPIETAPKDGTEFLAYDSRAKKMDVCYVIRFGTLGDLLIAVQTDGEYGPSEDEFGYNSEDITHWMPLPAPPKEQK